MDVDGRARVSGDVIGVGANPLVSSLSSELQGASRAETCSSSAAGIDQNSLQLGPPIQGRLGTVLAVG